MTDHSEIQDGIIKGMSWTLAPVSAVEPERSLLRGERHPSCGFELGLLCGVGSATEAEAWEHVKAYSARFIATQIAEQREILRRSLASAEHAQTTLRNWGVDSR